MIAFLVGLIIIVLLLGLLFKLIGAAIVIALAVGAVLVAQKFLGKNDRTRLP